MLCAYNMFTSGIEIKNQHLHMQILLCTEVFIMVNWLT